MSRLKGIIVDKNEEDIFDIFKDLRIQKNLIESLLSTSKITKKKKRGKKRMNIYLDDIYDNDDEEDIEEYYDIFYDLYRYPPDSNPPIFNNEKVLFPDFTIL